MTKKQIDEATVVNHLTLGYYSYFVNIDGEKFSKDSHEDKVTTRISSDKYGYQDLVIGYAGNKKQFIDVVYNYLKEYNYDNRS